MGCHGSTGKHKLGPISIGGDIHLLHECDHADAVGIFAPLYIWKNFRNPFKVAFTGFLLSVFIEFAQVPTNRLVDVDDVMMNTLGTMLGYLVWKMVGKHFFGGKEAQRTVSLGSCEPVIYLTLACACNFLLYNWTWFL